MSMTGRTLAVTTSLALIAHGGAIAQEPNLASHGTELTISARARAIQPGEVVRLDVACRCSPAERPGTARVFGREIQLVRSDDRPVWSGLIGIDVATAPGSYAVGIVVEPVAGKPLTAKYSLDVKAKRFPTRQLKVAPVYVDPPPAEVERILSEAKQLESLFDTTDLRGGFGPFQAPVQASPRSTFGARSIFNGQARSPHGGVDFGSPTGTPVAAPAAGIVALAADLFFTGQTVILDHGRGLYSVLAHLSSIAVAEGEAVERGAIVGAVGATGRVTGPHLHWGVRLNGARVDPLSLIDLLPPSP
jgi:murein DD-endopeptidase MepM/ murein hydrolase activator NlpD